MHKAKKKAETSGHTYSRFKNGPFLNQQDRVLYYDQILRAQYKTKLLKLFFLPRIKYFLCKILHAKCYKTYLDTLEKSDAIPTINS